MLLDLFCSFFTRVHAGVLLINICKGQNEEFKKIFGRRIVR